ncbi:MAG: AraC family transcriptional regulator [Tannerellaceae bacterium]|nr:AraC family transcriptional regulator [Tannerellaceae bacterium]
MLSLYCLFVLSAFAQNESDEHRHAIDSIRALIPTLEGEAKLKAYAELTNRQDAANDFSDSHLQTLNDYLAEAQRQKNAEKEGDARLAKAYFLYNKKDEAAFLKDIPDFLAFASKHGRWKNYFTVYEQLIDFHTIAGKYDEALRMVEDMYREGRERRFPLGVAMAARSMGETLQLMNRYADAEPFHREAVAVFEGENDLAQAIVSYPNLLNTLRRLKKYDETLALLTRWEEIQEKRDRQTGIVGQDDWFLMDLNYANVYSAMKKYDEAGRYYQKISTYADRLKPSNKEDYLYRLLMFYETTEQWTNALALTDTLYRIETELNFRAKALSILNHKAYTLGYLGRGAESAELYEVYIHQIDSVRRAEQSTRVDELRTQFEVDRHILEKEREHSYMLAALAGCLLLGGLLTGWVFYSRRLARKNRGLVRQILEQDCVAKELEQKEEELHRYQTLLKQQNPENTDETESEAETELLKRFKRLMQDSRVFTNPDLNWKSIIQELNTNEVYLRETVKQRFGCTIGDYINELRLNHARVLLVQKSEKYTVEAIAFDSGFNSRRTFYRLFYKQYGLSPSEYRKQINK